MMDDQGIECAIFPCGYVEGVLRIVALGLVPAGQLRLLTIAHDPWCVVLGGAGDRPCVPTYSLDGVTVTVPGDGDAKGRQPR